MTNVLSRLAANTFGLRILPAECHEISHPWHPNCFWALRDPLVPSWLFCLKTYGTLYALKALIDRRGRVGRVDWLRVLLNTVRSSFFLTTTEILFLAWLCIFRRLFGFATWPTVSVLNAFAACSMSVWMESKARRGILVPYLLNLASEAVFRQAQNRRWIRRNLSPFARAQSLLFGISVGLAIGILSKKEPNGQKSVRTSEFWRTVLHKTIGFAEAEEQGKSQEIHQKRRVPPICGSLPLNCPPNLPNSHFTCALKAFKLSLLNFSLSFAALTLLKLFNSLRSMPKIPTDAFSPTKNPKKLFELLRLPTFIGILPLLCQFSQCFCARFFPKKSAAFRRPIGVGLSATVAMAFLWPNNTLALYAFWKMVELAFFRLADAGILPVCPWADALLFSLLSSYLLGLAVLEPQALRPNYYKFLCSVTGDRLQLLNRPMFDAFFGTSSSSILHRDYRPEFVPHLRTINPAQYLPQMPFNKNYC